MNPIIYACWSKDFRRAFRKLLCSCFISNSNLSYNRNRIYKAPQHGRCNYYYKSKMAPVVEAESRKTSEEIEAQSPVDQPPPPSVKSVKSGIFKFRRSASLNSKLDGSGEGKEKQKTAKLNYTSQRNKSSREKCRSCAESATFSTNNNSNNSSGNGNESDIKSIFQIS